MQFITFVKNDGSDLDREPCVINTIESHIIRPDFLSDPKKGKYVFLVASPPKEIPPVNGVVLLAFIFCGAVFGPKAL